MIAWHEVLKKRNGIMIGQRAFTATRMTLGDDCLIGSQISW